MPYKLPAKLVEYLKTGPLRLEFPERELVKWAELYPYMDLQEMTWKRKKLLSLMAKMDNYSDYLLLWSPRDKKLWYLDIEHTHIFRKRTQNEQKNYCCIQRTTQEPSALRICSKKAFVVQIPLFCKRLGGSFTRMNSCHVWRPVGALMKKEH